MHGCFLVFCDFFCAKKKWLKVSFDDESMFKHAIIIIIHGNIYYIIGNLGDIS